MKTKTTKNKLKNNQNRSRKYKFYSPSFKILKKGFSIFASKQYDGQEILDFTKEEEKKYKTNCILSNISWFGDYKQAKHYETNDTTISKWIIKKDTKLLTTDKYNEKIIKYLFEKTKIKLSITINIKLDNELEKKMNEQNISTPYIYMNNNEKAYYEFCFAYGYITLKEQYEFLKFIKFLITNNFIDISMRNGKSIITKLNTKIFYYYYFNKTSKKEKYNRLSFYMFDKNALYNICKVFSSKYEIDGVFQRNTTSFWFPNLLVYEMDIKEYVLFNPHHNLIFDTSVES